MQSVVYADISHGVARALTYAIDLAYLLLRRIEMKGLIEDLDQAIGLSEWVKENAATVVQACNVKYLLGVLLHYRYKRASGDPADVHEAVALAEEAIREHAKNAPALGWGLRFQILQYICGSLPVLEKCIEELEDLL